MVSRRRALRASGVALLGALGGCTALSDSEAPREIGQVQVRSYVPESTTVQVLVREGGDPVYWKSKRVPSADEDGDEVGWVNFEGLPAEPSQYTLHVRTAAQADDEWETVDVGSRNADCLTYRAEIGYREDGHGRLDEISMLVSANDSYCERKDET